MNTSKQYKNKDYIDQSPPDHFDTEQDPNYKNWVITQIKPLKLIQIIKPIEEIKHDQ